MDKECETVNPESIIIGGHGQGGALAIYAAYGFEILKSDLIRLRYPKKISGIISVNGFALFDGKFSIKDANRETDITCLHGEANSKVSR